VVGSTEQVDLQRLFLSEKFNSNIKNSTLKILDNLLQVTIEIINDQEWISSITKNSILKSLNNMEHRIAYSDSIFDQSEENKTKYVKINSDMNSRYQLTRHYVNNIFILKKRSYLKELDLIGTRQSERIRSKKYVFDIFLANLMYLKEHNTMLMPAGVLIEPIYSVSSPVYLNYATIGMFYFFIKIIFCIFRPYTYTTPCKFTLILYYNSLLYKKNFKVGNPRIFFK
jgi:predicted metalloendopeptidase